MKQFLLFLKEFNYWQAIPFYGLLIILTTSIPEFSRFIIFILIVFPFYGAIKISQDFKEYCEFKKMIDSKDYQLYLKGVQTSGTVYGYSISHKSDLIFKNGSIYCLTYNSPFARKATEIFFCIEFRENNVDKNPLSLFTTPSFFTEVQKWKITSSGNIQLLGKGKFSKNLLYNSGIEINIFSDVERIIQYLPKEFQRIT